MSLIGIAFRNVTLGLVILVAFVTFLLWNRIPGPQAVRFTGRAVLLLTGEFLGIVALPVSLNISYGGLVVSWSDLLGDQSVAGARLTGQVGRVALSQMHVATRLRSAVATGTVHPFILVVPVIPPYANHSSPRDDEECTDLSAHDRIETWLTRDVRSMVLTDFRAIDDPLGWGLMGYSTGGFCAADLLLRHPAECHSAVSISGYYSPESPLVLADPALARAHDPVRLVSTAQAPAVSLLMTASAQDRIDPPAESAAMVAAARAGPAPHDTEVREYVAPLGGGHNQSAWEKMLPTAFRWFSARLSPPVRPT